MTAIKVRFFCEYCKKTLLILINEELQKEAKKNVDKWPYPFVYHHAGHYSIIYLDKDWKERGVVCSKIEIPEKS